MLYVIIAYLFSLLGALGWAAVSIMSAALPPLVRSLEISNVVRLGGRRTTRYCHGDADRLVRETDVSEHDRAVSDREEFCSR